LSDHSKKDVDQIAKDCDRDYYLTSLEAKEYKLIDNILKKRIIPGDKKEKEEKS